jgi:hypothetical protein
MRVSEISATAEALYARMEKDRYSQSVIDVTKWVIGHFERYCSERSIILVDVPIITRFLLEQYDIEYQYPKLRMQSQLRRPLLIMLEFYESGNYCKTHQRGSTTEIPLEYADFFIICRDFVNGQSIGVKSKARKLWTITNYLAYLVDMGMNIYRLIAQNRLTLRGTPATARGPPPPLEEAKSFGPIWRGLSRSDWGSALFGCRNGADTRVCPYISAPATARGPCRAFGRGPFDRDMRCGVSS